MYFIVLLQHRNPLTCIHVWHWC